MLDCSYFCKYEYFPQRHQRSLCRGKEDHSQPLRKRNGLQPGRPGQRTGNQYSQDIPHRRRNAGRRLPGRSWEAGIGRRTPSQYLWPQPKCRLFHRHRCGTEFPFHRRHRLSGTCHPLRKQSPVPPCQHGRIGLGNVQDSIGTAGQSRDRPEPDPLLRSESHRTGQSSDRLQLLLLHQ